MRPVTLQKFRCSQIRQGEPDQRDAWQRRMQCARRFDASCDAMPPCHAHNIDQVLTQHLGMRARDYHCQMFDEYSGKGLEIAGVGWMATVDGSTLTTEQQNRCYAELGAFND